MSLDEPMTLQERLRLQAILREGDDRLYTEEDEAAAALDEAEAEIERLRAKVARHESDRAYIVGHNDGWDAAVDAVVEGRDIAADRAALEDRT